MKFLPSRVHGSTCSRRQCRDLKLENFLFSNMDNNSELKMIDFGLSKHFTFGEVHHDAVGTREFDG